MALSLNNSTFASVSAPVVSAYPFTLAGWFRVPNVTVLLQLMGLQDTTGDARYHLYFSGHVAGQVVANAFLGDYGRAVSAVSMSPDQWHHVAGVFHSDSLREIYLDGVMSGSNTAVRAFTGDDYCYIGSKDSVQAVDVAEAFVAAVALSGDKIAALSAGCPPPSVVGLANLRLYQDGIARLNRSGVGPALTSCASPAKVVHPRVTSGAGCGMTAAPYRVAGPWMRQASLGSASTSNTGQIAVGGVAGAAAVFTEVLS